LNKTLFLALNKPTAVSVSLLYANINFRKAEYENVIRWLNNAAQNLGYPETKVAVYRTAQIHLLQGQVYLSKGKVKEAIQIFEGNIETLEGYDAQRESYMALFSLYLGQEMWREARDLEIRIRSRYPTALDRHTVDIKKIFEDSSPEKKIRFYTHYMNYAQAIHDALSLPTTDLETKFALMELYYLADRGDEAEKVIAQILAEGQGDYAEKALVFFDKSLAARKDQPKIAHLANRLRNDFLTQLKEVW
jgi:tetratricopeptide (TPR) repeat protein